MKSGRAGDLEMKVMRAYSALLEACFFSHMVLIILFLIEDCLIQLNIMNPQFKELELTGSSL